MAVGTVSPGMQDSALPLILSLSHGSSYALRRQVGIEVLVEGLDVLAYGPASWLLSRKCASWRWSASFGEPFVGYRGVIVVPFGV